VTPYRLGFAVKILGGGGMKTSDTRRWQNRPHLRVSLEYLDAAFDYLDAIDVRVFRLSSSTVPYGTHPDLPEFAYERQISACSADLEALGAKATQLGLRLSTHPGQYTVINSPSDELTTKSMLDLEQDALLLDVLGQPVHVGGAYGDRASALARWATAYERLSTRARRRVAVEHDDATFSLADVLWLHDRTGVRVVYDLHHDRCNPAAGVGMSDALATWGGVRPKVHLSAPRLALPRASLQAHADFVAPWDLRALLEQAPTALDVMLEAKAKDLAVLALRRQLRRVDPELAAAEEVSDKSLTEQGAGRHAV
jgi:UV DNA damage endonuclease